MWSFLKHYDGAQPGKRISQNVLKFYQQLTGEERMVPFIFGQNNQ
jgi:hypothetical protein